MTPPDNPYVGPPFEELEIPPAFNEGGVWIGTIPPDDPDIGWLWRNQNNDGLYIYDVDGFWVQIGTNW